MSRSRNSRRGRAKQGTGRNGHGCGRRCGVCYPHIARAAAKTERKARVDIDGEVTAHPPREIICRDAW